MVAAFHVGKVPPSIPSLRDDLGADLRQAGWLLAMVNLTAAVGGMTIALTVDRFGHRRLIVLGTALCGVASLLGAFADSIDLLLVWRFLEGLGFIIVTVSVPTLVLRVTEPRDRHRAMTIWTSLHAGRRGRHDADRGRHPARDVMAGGLAGGVGRVAGHARRAAPARRAAARARCPAGQPAADPARDGGSGDQRRAARDSDLLRRLFLLLARHRRLPANLAGRAPGLLDRHGGDRHGAGDGGERRPATFWPAFCCSAACRAPR